MLAAIVLSLLTSAAVPVSAVDPDPAIRISLDHSHLERGDQARIHIHVRDDGYVVVLHSDPFGHVRVLFPVDPGDDDFLRGGHDYEIRSRGDRDAIRVDVSSGSGSVYAAYSQEPFRFDAFVRGDHWDFGALTDSADSTDPEAQLNAIVSLMSTTSRFTYDIASYDVGTTVVAASASSYDPYYGGGSWWPYYTDPFYYRPAYFAPRSVISVDLCFGCYRHHYRYGYSAFYDPYYDPFVYAPYRYAYRPYRPIFYYGPTYVYGARPYGGSRLQPYGFKGNDPFGGGSIGYRTPTLASSFAQNRATQPFHPLTPYRTRASGQSALTPRATSAVGPTRRGAVVATPAVERSATRSRIAAEPRSSAAQSAPRMPVRRQPADAEPPRAVRATDGRVSDPRQAPRRETPAASSPRGSQSTPPARRVQPVRPEPVRSEPVRSEPRRVDPVRTEPVRSAPVRSEPVRSEPVRREPVRESPVRAEPTRVSSPPRQSAPTRISSPPRVSSPPHVSRPASHVSVPPRSVSRGSHPAGGGRRHP